MLQAARESVEPFRCEISRDRGAPSLRPVGDLDLGTAPLLSAELDKLRAAGFRRLILDLSGVRFMDSSGLRCILRYETEGQRSGFNLVLVPGSPAVQRIFELTGTHSRLSFIGASWAARPQAIRRSVASWHSGGGCP